MNTGKIEIIYGEGSARTAMALGKGLEALIQHKKVIVIQFLKGNQKEESQEVMRRLEPDMNLFCFEKARCRFDELTEQEKQEESKVFLFCTRGEKLKGAEFFFKLACIRSLSC